MATKAQPTSLYIGLGITLIAISLTTALSLEHLEQKAFYLILILFGLGISVLLFGTMKSLAILTGNQAYGNYSFSGPIVGVILVVLGYYHFNPENKKFLIQFNVFGEGELPIQQGRLTIYLEDIIEKPITLMGQVQIQGISKENLGKYVRCIVISDGYEPYIKDSLLLSDQPIDIFLSRVYSFIIEGKVLTAADIPISDVEVNIKNTSYLDITRQDGSFSIEVKEFKKDKIFLVTSHPNYQDKEVSVELRNTKLKMDITIAPNSNPTGSFK